MNKESVFSKKDFSLCIAYVPKGYPQSQTHVGVARIGGRTIMVSSPFPNIKRNKFLTYCRVGLRKLSLGLFFNEKPGEYYENPCIYINDDQNHPSKIFRLLQTRPLMEPLDPFYGLPAYNSDPDIYVEGDSIYVLNRCIYRTRLTPQRKRDEYDIRIFLIKGLFIDGKYKYMSTNLFKETTDLIVSPCLTRYKGKYIYTSLWTNSYNDGESFEGLRFIEGNKIEDLASNEDWLDVHVDVNEWIPWHMSLLNYNEKLYSIVACVKRGEPHRCYQMLGVFDDDLGRMTIYPTPLSDIPSYRGAAYVDEKGMFVLYNTTVYEKMKGGRSVDGREIIMASMPFEKLLVIIS